MTDAGGAPDLRTVRILGFPLALFARAQEHHADLLREFAYVAEPADPDDVPDRLILISESLRTRFGAFTAGPEADRDAAAARGDDTVDLEFRVPPDVAAAAAELGHLLDEADDYCRRGDLLTLSTPPELLTFRQWYLDEFRRQVAGEPPTPWAEYQATRETNPVATS